MASQTAICNRALETIGVAPILDISDDLPQAKALNRVWSDSLRAFLNEHPWHFAKKRADIAASATLPSWGWDFYYPVPADFLRLLMIKDKPDFSLEAMADGSQAIAANAASPLYILYIYNLTDPARLPPHAVEALARWLANDVVAGLTESNTKSQKAQNDLGIALSRAKRINGMQKQPDPLQWGSFVESRHQFLINANPILTTDGQS
jgi:hypothetical protein